MVCPQGHAFDRGRKGYWNLLQPQDRRSSTPGDTDAAVQARGRWLAAGFAEGLVETISGMIAGSPVESAVDLGCGDGYFAKRLLESGSASVCGVDLSTPAIRSAACHWPEATWVVANVDRFVPLLDASCDLALTIFGRRPVSELRRILRPGGLVMVVLPGADDLIELRQAASGRAEPREQVADRVGEFGPEFRVAERGRWSDRVHLGRSAIDDALAMSYRGARHTQRERLRDLSELEVTLSAEILAFERLSAQPRPKTGA